MTYYVTMTDRFMSNWGHAKNKKNKLIFVCDNYEEAEIVEINARNRTDMQYIHICTRKPDYWRESLKPDYTTKDYYVQIKTRNDYPGWYKPGYFSRP